MATNPLLSLFLFLSFIASMGGGMIPISEELLKKFGLERILSFRSGILISVALFDVIPESWQISSATCVLSTMAALMLGLWLHDGHSSEHEGHELTHPHIHNLPHGPTPIFALFFHSLLDGINLGAAAYVGNPALVAIGSATSLHKIADGFTLVSFFKPLRKPSGRVLLLLVLISLATPVGALVARLGTPILPPTLISILLGFAAGSFLFVSAQQIIPHLRRERDTKCAVSFVFGALLMYFLS